MNKKGVILTIITVISLIVAVVCFFYKQPNLGSIGIQQKACTVSTVSSSTIGHQLSTTLLNANSRRAWARIEQIPNQTNIVYLSFDEGAAAITTSGLILTPATTTSPILHIDFGLGTDFPYTGAVTGITNTSSTTVHITQCVY